MSLVMPLAEMKWNRAPTMEANAVVEGKAEDVLVLSFLSLTRTGPSKHCLTIRTASTARKKGRLSRE